MVMMREVVMKHPELAYDPLLSRRASYGCSPRRRSLAFFFQAPLADLGASAYAGLVISEHEPEE